MSARKELRCRNCDHLVAVVTFPSPARPSECHACTTLAFDDEAGLTFERVHHEYVCGRQFEVSITRVTDEAGTTTYDGAVRGQRETFDLNATSALALQGALQRLADELARLK